jgi:hypothetical protein
MDNYKFEPLKNEVQEIIDLISRKDYAEAKNKLFTTSEMLDELLDFSEADEDLIEISRFQVLLNQLQIKVNAVLN